jgi:hypothetical protein
VVRARPHGAGNNCFRLGPAPDGTADIAVNGGEQYAVSDSLAVLRTLIPAIKAGKADHFL